MTDKAVPKLMHFLSRNKQTLIDGSAVSMVTLLALYYAYEVDIFCSAEGGILHANRIEIAELMMVAAVFCGGLTLFALRRLSELRKETRRRLAVETEVRTLAFTDALTGLANRRHFDTALTMSAQTWPRAGGSHAVMSLDLNGFKRINDLYGHAVGDEVLMRVAARLRDCVRDGDVVARVGGDEFAILATHSGGVEAATGLALRIVEAMSDPVAAGAIAHDVGVAIGIALVPQDGVDGPELLRKADVALYRAKKAGVSDLCFFEPSMDVSIRERAMLERELADAVGSGAIEPWYQPLVDVKSGDLRGFEALARWPRESDTIGPERFIPILEESGLIATLTDQLFEQACREACSWPAHLELAFNVSPNLLRDPAFPMRVLATLSRTGFPAGRLELEITESAMVRDIGAAQRTLGGLRAAGIRIALDDFGTGYSSLFHLRNFKVDRLKIDRSFVESMTTDSDSAAIVKALIGLGEGLGLEVTAEGVETLQQRRMLETQGCHHAQGFYYGHALPAAGVRLSLEQGS
jgi:diguanylate cyclase (GGDEF)-like protein